MADQVNPFSALIDERSIPTLRFTLGQLLASAKTADIAITHLRLAGLDLTSAEATGLEKCRVMLGRLDAAALNDASLEAEGFRHRVQLLRQFAHSGRLEIRTAPHHVWNPDFSVFSGLPDNECLALVGAHYFGQPYPLYGLVLTCVLKQPHAIRLCRSRFEELWQAGYDVLPVVADTLDRFAA
jgi:hypothetical protein